MTINNITVRNLGSVIHRSCSFTDGLNLLCGRDIEALSLAIRFVLNHKTYPLPSLRAGADTAVEAEVCIAKNTYFVTVAPKSNQARIKLCCRDSEGNDVTREYLRLTSHCVEYDLSDVFEGEADTTLLRFLQYADEDFYYLPNELARRTDGLSDIKFFRTYLRSFIEDFEPETIRPGKCYEIAVDKGGRYFIKYKDGAPLSAFSESDKALFRYLCFLRTAEFWQDFEKIRNLHGVKKPFIIKNFLERLDESIDVTELFNRTLKLGRQIFLLTQ